MESLPEDILCLFANNLDPRDLIALSCTSTKLAKFYFLNKSLLHQCICNRLMPLLPASSTLFLKCYQGKKVVVSINEKRINKIKVYPYNTGKDIYNSLVNIAKNEVIAFIEWPKNQGLLHRAYNYISGSSDDKVLDIICTDLLRDGKYSPMPFYDQLDEIRIDTQSYVMP